jgi:signal transduction histidine kinase
LRFDGRAFDRLFPFHLLIDRELTVTRAGPVLRRLMPALAPPTSFSDHFAIRRPTTVACTFDALGDEERTIFLLTAAAPGDLVLKGQMVYLEEEDALGFFGSPWITRLDQLEQLGLTVADFAIHDSVADFLVLIQAQATALDDASALASQLREARDAAVRASRVKSEFLAQMSHELRTPLNAILGFSETLTAGIFGPLSDRYRAYAGHIHSSGRLLLDYINDLLDLARIEAGRYEVTETPVVIAEALRECVTLVGPEIQRKKIGLTLNLGPPNLTLRLDSRALGQIFLNLLSNAVKFTDDAGSVGITVAVEPEAIVIAVSDTGIGIAAEMLRDIFEPFRQAHARISHKYGGTGLGLSICRNLVALHNGTIAIDSQLGVGTTATVRFPASRIVA